MRCSTPRRPARALPLVATLLVTAGAGCGRGGELDAAVPDASLCPEIGAPAQGFSGRALDPPARVGVPGRAFTCRLTAETPTAFDYECTPDDDTAARAAAVTLRFGARFSGVPAGSALYEGMHFTVASARVGDARNLAGFRGDLAIRADGDGGGGVRLDGTTCNGNAAVRLTAVSAVFR